MDGMEERKEEGKDSLLLSLKQSLSLAWSASGRLVPQCPHLLYGQVLQKQNTAFREEEDAHKPQEVKRSYMQEEKNMEDY